MSQKRPVQRRVLLAMGCALAVTTAVAQEPQGPTTLTETYDSWTVRCVRSGEGEQRQRRCQMLQELLQQESRQRVLLFAIAKQGDNAARATLIMPFGLLLSEGVRIEIAEQEIARGAFRTCLPAGCVVEIELADSVIQQLQTGDTVSVLMTANSGQAARTDVSLTGFTAAYQRLVALAAG